MSVGLNILALLSPGDASGKHAGLLDKEGESLDFQGSSAFSELLNGTPGDALETMLDALPEAEREAMLAAIAQLALIKDGNNLPPAVDQLLQDLPEMPALTDEAAVRLQQGGDAALDVLATLVPEWRQWLSDAADDIDSERLQAVADQVADSVAQAVDSTADADAAEDADSISTLAAAMTASAAAGQPAVSQQASAATQSDAEPLPPSRFSLAQLVNGQKATADEPASGRDSQPRLDVDVDKNTLSNDDFSGLRRKATLDMNANANANATPRAAEVALRAEPSSRRSGGEEAAEAVRVSQPGSAAAAAALTARPVAAATQALGVPFGQAGWSEAVVDKVMWMSSRNLNSVEIRLTPAELGPLEIHLQNRGQELQVQFVSQNPSVREVLESQVIRLREMVGQQGLDLVDVSVGDNGANQQQEQAERQAARLAGQVAGGTAAGNAANSPQSTLVPVASSSDRLVDYYA
ncbi:flagellar hook-length control protein FliK [Halopseudomonas salegens]|uniref:Flagellar hook-length control protein FliK n=1 Tax=Halopseudomonas salegens TaxID=1434072 RepID=A0A1H2EMK0_9GAMM|nr:flagellar hook-length control protein FliK [Halopseudomonas salegens]SDT96412.1 Flagellar hook-length control protein FliK [Halopseudomonas salegens]